MKKVMTNAMKTIIAATLLTASVAPTHAQLLKPARLQPAEAALVQASATNYVMDSICTMQMDGTPLQKQVPEYNADGLAIALYEYGYSQSASNADGTTQQETVTIPLGNYTITEFVAYEYDSHQTATRITVTASVMEQVVESEEVVYENSYDERDLLVEQKTMRSGEEPTISLMFWSDGLTTAVAAQRLQRQVRERSFDLSGRQQHDGQKPKGVYIIGGRKVVRR